MTQQIKIIIQQINILISTKIRGTTIKQQIIILKGQILLSTHNQLILSGANVIKTNIYCCINIRQIKMEWKNLEIIIFILYLTGCVRFLTYLEDNYNIQFQFILLKIMQSNQNIKYTEEYGGSGGSQFSDQIIGKMQLRKVLIHSGHVVDSIQLMLGMGNKQRWLQKHGGNGGQEHCWEVPFGQHIKFVEIFYGQLVNSIIFVTNEGVRSPKYGGGGGTKQIITIPDGYGIIGVRGSSGASLDKLGFITEKLQNQQQTNQLNKGFHSRAYNQNQKLFTPTGHSHHHKHHHHP